MRKIQNIVIVGTGNVAWHICKILLECGFERVEVIGRNQSTLYEFELEFNVVTASISSDINTNADLYILALPDDVISVVSKNLNTDIQGLIVHTSGTGNMDLLSSFTNYGVMYPLQTMVKGEDLDFKKVPLLIETNNDDRFNELLTFTKTLSNEVDVATSVQRQKLHIAAVFTNNFTNHMVSIAREICEKEKISFSYLQPLLIETISKIQYEDAREIQTGPAIRNDKTTITKHLSFLEDQKDRQLLYQLITSSIQEMHENKDTFEA